MEFTSRDDIDVPIDQAFEMLTDFEQFERAALRRGAEVTRLDDLARPGVGARWQASFSFRGKPREMTIAITEYDRPNEIRLAAAVAGIAVLGLAGREVYQRAQLPLVSVEEPAENPSASQPPQAGVSAGQGASGETVPTNAADAPETADSADNPDTAAPDMAPDLDPPSFDVVRVDPDGTTVIAQL